MDMLKRIFFVFLLIIQTEAFTSALCYPSAKDATVVYLSWIEDPCHTMTIQWHSERNDRSCKVFYQKAGSLECESKVGTNTPLIQTNFLVNTVELTDLEADTEYFFRFDGKEACHKFRTMPEKLNRDIRFVVGGDVYYFFDKMHLLNVDIAKRDPDFVIVGGDIAYAFGRPHFFPRKNGDIRRWRYFLKEWTDQMVGADGRLIPMVVVIGNHDVKNSEKDPAKRAAIFYNLFAMPNKNTSYRTLDFGSYLSLFLLDTGHSYPVSGEQTKWLENELLKKESTAHKMAAYHVAAYPAVYPFEGTGPKLIRQNWVPLFEKYQVGTAFEHHNHAYKRTFRIKENKVDPNGVLYLGDGVWGVYPRKVHSYKRAWYLEKAESINSYWLVTLGPEQNQFQSFDAKGKIIEEFPLLKEH